MPSAPSVYNKYELNGEGITVTYLPDGEGPLTPQGPVVLGYTGSSGIQMNYRRPQVRINHNTPIGDLITVALNESTDANSVTFTIILPTAIVDSGTPEAPKGEITALGITTVHEGTIAGPRGEKYTAVALNGTASRVLEPLLVEPES